MAQTIPREQVLSVLQGRYDYHSAEVVLKRAVAAAKPQDQERYSSEELRSIGKELQKVGDRLDRVIGSLMALADSASPGTHTPSARVESSQTSAAESSSRGTTGTAQGETNADTVTGQTEEVTATAAGDTEGTETTETADEPGGSTQAEQTDTKPRPPRRRR
jgi:hypothetical protein